jgi:hypothetical protein
MQIHLMFDEEVGVDGIDSQAIQDRRRKVP